MEQTLYASHRLSAPARSLNFVNSRYHHPSRSRHLAHGPVHRVGVLPGAQPRRTADEIEHVVSSKGQVCCHAERCLLGMDLVHFVDVLGSGNPTFSSPSFVDVFPAILPKLPRVESGSHGVETFANVHHGNDAERDCRLDHRPG